jgi:ABC-type transporter Mla maintaining outer membrane lipid asymmetry ATPase subunit MlaF
VILKLIVGLLKPDSGIIRVDGQRTDAMTEARRATRGLGRRGARHVTHGPSRQ